MNRSRIRPPAVAGMFYPAEIRELRRMVKQYLAEAEDTGTDPRAVIGPHAGFVYSGPVAGSAYKQLEGQWDSIRRVVLLGPSHHVPLRGLAAGCATAFETPLGLVPVDQEAVTELLRFSQVRVMDAAHEPEHSLETHLPFLQSVLEDFSIVPLVVGDTEPEAVCEIIDWFADRSDTLMAVSSDLSHYHDYESARRLDEATSRAIEDLNPDAIQFEQACGRIPIQGLLLHAQRHNLKARTVDLRNSGDTAGPRDRVVGYGAYVFS